MRRTIVQLSDLHLGAFAAQEALVIEPLIAALAALHAAQKIELVAITGDLFETSSIAITDAVAIFRRVLERLRAALGSDVPVVLLPGNHDRRASGLLGPHDAKLFDALAGAADPRCVVTGCKTPFLAETIDRELHALPWLVAAFDSSYLPTGWISAGGILRQDDLLQLADQTSDEPPSTPLLLLTHHHIVPTPLTDLSRVDVNTQSVILRWAARNVLARLLSNADHEELMMTALGAGTALSTLHAFGRPVVVLHGHKHFPVARALSGPHTGHGDVLLVSAGSAGMSLTWTESDLPDVARLWPSFNVIEIDGAGDAALDATPWTIAVDVVAFRPRRTEEDPVAPRVARRPLLRARADGLRWDIDPVAGDPVSVGTRIRALSATAKVLPNAARGGLRADLGWTVRVVAEDSELERGDDRTYYLCEDAMEGASLDDLCIGEARAGDRPLPARIEVPLDGTVCTYRVVGGLCLTRSEATRVRGELAAFEDVTLLNRYESGESTLTVEGVPDGVRAFGSVLDLTTGHERPARVERPAPGTIVLRVSPCPTRTLLQVRWPLVRD
ncbi:MAG: metallophosphoesterase [Myxococcales bacterium]|nr:metallophosphoesterase [Myxococcales bacterium]